MIPKKRKPTCSASTRDRRGIISSLLLQTRPSPLEKLTEPKPNIAAVIVLPVVDELASPVVRVGGAVREPAVPPGELNAIGRLIIHELGAFDRIWRVAALDPVDKHIDDVCLCGQGSLALSKHPCTRALNAAYTTVRHTANAEVAEEGVEVTCGSGELRGDGEVVALRVCTRCQP
jgi:hypothetical protein